MTENDAERARFYALYDSALHEVIRAVRCVVAAGAVARATAEPELSMRENGLPTLTDGSHYSPKGRLDFAALLDPPFGDDEARRSGRYPVDRFPSVHRLWDAVAASEGLTISPGKAPAELIQIHVKLQLDGMVNAHFRRFSVLPDDAGSRHFVLEPVMRGIFEGSLRLAIVAPVALVRFDFDRVRLASDLFLMRMSDAFQRARWGGKAYGANGHDSVLAAATHAVVITGWTIPNADFLTLGRQLSWRTAEAQAKLERVFAILRLETGVETGYAQELRLARGWRVMTSDDRPEVYAVGARRYPERFDDFGWMRDDVPVLSRSEVMRVGETYRAALRIPDTRLDIALRRLNAAMIREEPADAVLDCTIGLEVLLGDDDSQATSWKLRLRAAALVSLASGAAKGEETHQAVKRLYGIRSAIVHGATGRKPVDAAAGRAAAISILRDILRAAIANPIYLDPAEIDRRLLMGFAPP